MPSDSSFDTMFTLIPILIVVLLLIGGAVTLMNWKKATDAGVNPLTMETEAMTTLIRSRALAADQPVEARLAALDALHAKGTITAAELTTARAEVFRNL